MQVDCEVAAAVRGGEAGLYGVGTDCGASSSSYLSTARHDSHSASLWLSCGFVACSR